MRPARIQIVTGGIMFALLAHPFALAQDPPLPPVAIDGPRKAEPLPADPTLQPAPSQPSGDQLPDSPGAMQARPQDPPSTSSSPQGSTSSSATDSSAVPTEAKAEPTPQTPPQQTQREPLGTAAAESVPTLGVAASRPAGAAVAPAKQRRVRSILIKVGALVGAGVAIGTTMALSQGSPSKPPGSR